MTAPATPSIALFGGSFDPPHVGHVLAATWALSTAAIDELVVMPAFDHAFDKPLTPFAHRLRMAELAFAPLRAVTVSDLEARLGGASYTVRTLEHLRQERPDASWRLLVGTDLVTQIPRWHEGHRIPSLAGLVVVGRGGFERGEEDLHMPEVSSSEVRRRLRAGEPAEALVPREVLGYIAEHGLYAP
ncbi:MAG: nicotinate (nicotinamide) nucleotide adenylyltransferase [Sandaracinaceae bacterium]|nr:nicotinate (nicotinamide) nucleotide adenylyltransferase [Sandaracinaceae bacterium]